MSLAQVLDQNFRATCKIVLGKEIGSMDEWGDWLSEYAKKPIVRKSSLSGKRIIHVASNNYPENGKFLHFDEIDFNKKFEPLNINEIKDMDSIVEALQERIIYTGSVVLGNSKQVEDSTNVTDSFYIYKSNSIWKCKYMAYSSYSKGCSYLFGTHDTASSEYLLRGICIGGPRGNRRCFESSLVTDSSDIYYSLYMEGCSECMFSFFQKGKRNLIGNLPLPKGKYLSVKRKLLEEVTGELIGKGSTLGFVDLFEKSDEEVSDEGFGAFDGEEIDKAFNNTAKVLLGRDLGNVDGYADWFANKLDFYDLKFVKSAISGEPVPSTKEYFGFTEGIKHITLGEIQAASKRGIPINEKTDLHQLKDKLKEHTGYCPVFNQNCKKVDCPVLCVNTWNARKCTMPVLSKNVAYCFWPRESENVFGSSIMFNSSFVIKGIRSSGITRAFEVESCSNSSDIYFSHNVENGRNCMFCFNVKNLFRGIGNAEYPVGTYSKIKHSLLEQVASELQSKKFIRWNIYGIGKARQGES
ncbi:MAG: hypothetical protein ABIG39_04585 [Candidatus Micrarchaeota archaeon]